LGIFHSDTHCRFLEAQYLEKPIEPIDNLIKLDGSNNFCQFAEES